MSTTTIRLPEDLKERVLQTAERTGQSPHGFILKAIEEKTERERELVIGRKSHGYVAL